MGKSQKCRNKKPPFTLEREIPRAEFAILITSAQIASYCYCPREAFPGAPNEAVCLERTVSLQQYKKFHKRKYCEYPGCKIQANTHYTQRASSSGITKTGNGKLRE